MIIKINIEFISYLQKISFNFEISFYIIEDVYL